MESNESTAKPWSSKQVYGLAVVCLLSGIVIGYMLRAPLQSGTVKIQAAKAAPAHASDAKIAPGGMRQAADKQAEPLLAQLQKSPDDPVLMAEIGKIYYQMRQFPVAASYFENSVRLKPDAGVFVNLGGVYHFGGDDEKAIGAWNQALRLDPDNPDALFNIGYVKWQAQGDRKAAIAAWQQLLKTNPNHPKRAQVEDLIAQAKQHPNK